MYQVVLSFLDMTFAHGFIVNLLDGVSFKSIKLLVKPDSISLLDNVDEKENSTSTNYPFIPFIP